MLILLFLPLGLCKNVVITSFLTSRIDPYNIPCFGCVKKYYESTIGKDFDTIVVHDELDDDLVNLLTTEQFTFVKVEFDLHMSASEFQYLKFREILASVYYEYIIFLDMSAGYFISNPFDYFTEDNLYLPNRKDIDESFKRNARFCYDSYIPKIQLSNYNFLGGKREQFMCFIECIVKQFDITYTGNNCNIYGYNWCLENSECNIELNFEGWTGCGQNVPILLNHCGKQPPKEFKQLTLGNFIKYPTFKYEEYDIVIQNEGILFNLKTWTKNIIRGIIFFNDNPSRIDAIYRNNINSLRSKIHYQMNIPTNPHFNAIIKKAKEYHRPKVVIWGLDERSYYWVQEIKRLGGRISFIEYSKKRIKEFGFPEADEIILQYENINFEPDIIVINHHISDNQVISKSRSLFLSKKGHLYYIDKK